MTGLLVSFLCVKYCIDPYQQTDLQFIAKYCLQFLLKAQCFFRQIPGYIYFFQNLNFFLLEVKMNSVYNLKSFLSFILPNNFNYSLIFELFGQIFLIKYPFLLVKGTEKWLRCLFHLYYMLILAVIVTLFVELDAILINQLIAKIMSNSVNARLTIPINCMSIKCYFHHLFLRSYFQQINLNLEDKHNRILSSPFQVVNGNYFSKLRYFICSFQFQIYYFGWLYQFCFICF